MCNDPILSQDISLRDAFHLALLEHLHGLIAMESPACGVEGAKRLDRQFSLEAICAMVSPGDPRYKEKESDHGGELQGGPFPQGDYPDGCALVRRVSLELSAYRRTDGGARG